MQFNSNAFNANKWLTKSRLYLSRRQLLAIKLTCEKTQITWKVQVRRFQSGSVLLSCDEEHFGGGDDLLERQSKKGENGNCTPISWEPATRIPSETWLFLSCAHDSCLRISPLPWPRFYCRPSGAWKTLRSHL